jgi:hypothetical protein
MWMTYRIHRQQWDVISVNGNSAEFPSSDGFKPTRLTIRARSQKEAMRKADKLWQECEFGIGSIIVVPETNHASM